jgi:predicted amidophosphoribosyltransferase
MGGMRISGIGAAAPEWQDGVMERAESLVKMSAVRPLRSIARGLLDLLYPPLCLGCDKPVANADVLCAECFRTLRPITAPLCPVLGLPFEVSLGPEARSVEAIADPPPFERARSAVVYNDIARALVSRLKYGDRPELARFCARLMARAGHELWGADVVLIPVPLHRTRQFSRRYNQSTELARAERHHRHCFRSCSRCPQEENAPAGGALRRRAAAQRRRGFCPASGFSGAPAWPPRDHRR